MTDLLTVPPTEAIRSSNASVHEEIFEDSAAAAHGTRVICIAVDESDCSEHAFHWALKNTITKDDQVVLLNCRPFNMNAMSYSISGDYSSSLYVTKDWMEAIEANQRQVSHELLRRFGNLVLDKGIKCR
ncbi:hypothetical protein HDU76_010865, partial [Blyttiomyces sp. JEL0837]